MKQWHCHIDGQQYGPVDEATLKQWIAEGRVSRSTNVWSEGMANWQPAGTVPELFGTGPAGAPPLPVAQGGTGGRTENCDLTARARQMLSGRWGLPIGFCLLLGLIFVGIGLVTSAIPGANMVANLILTGPLTLGGVIFFLTFTRGQQGQLGMLFAGFSRFGSALAAHLLITLIVLLYLLPVLVPGGIVLTMAGPNPEESPIFFAFFVFILIGVIISIVIQLRYSQTYYIMADDPTISAWQAMKRSRSMMDGYKGKLFCLQLRFIGWGILSVLTCHIGLIWLIPYINTSFACFYQDLLPPVAAPAEEFAPSADVIVRPQQSEDTGHTGDTSGGGGDEFGPSL